MKVGVIRHGLKNYMPFVDTETAGYTLMIRGMTRL